MSRDPVRKLLRSARRGQASDLLTQAGIPHQVYDNGSYIYVEDGQGGVDFWPSTQDWRLKGRPYWNSGMAKLIDHVRRAQMRGIAPSHLSNSA